MSVDVLDKWMWRIIAVVLGFAIWAAAWWFGSVIVKALMEWR